LLDPKNDLLPVDREPPGSSPRWEDIMSSQVASHVNAQVVTTFETKQRSNARHLVTAARILTGLSFLVFGLDGFLHYIPQPTTGIPEGALAFGAAHGHEAVLTSGCDLPDLPLDLAERLRPGPAVVRGQPLLGLWPVELAGELVRWLEADRDRAMRSWIAHAGARIVALPFEVRNVNRPEDLEGRPPQ
jgi:molybdopterin-guanine dinucleotide biosynthesis protein A